MNREPCTVCAGVGYTDVDVDLPTADLEDADPCQWCLGTGFEPDLG